MKRIIITALMLASASGDIPPGAPDPHVTFTRLEGDAPGGMARWRFDWTGTGGWTYFVQWSDDLANWHYFPVVDNGAVHDPFEFASNASKSFTRLIYTDIPTDDAENADFDNDGLTNLFEVMHGMDPMKANTGGASLSDGNSDPDGDGLLNTSEQAKGTDPAAKDNPLVSINVVVSGN